MSEQPETTTMEVPPVQVVEETTVASVASSPRPRRAEADGPLLDDKHFDAVLVGTGLTNTILASALAKAGRTVLHLDQATEYGAQLATHSLATLKAFVEEHRGGLDEPARARSRQPTEEQLTQWREATKDDKEASSLEFEPVMVRSSFYSATFEDFTEPTAAAPAAAAVTAAGEDAAAASSSASEPAAPSQPVVTPLMAEARRFSIDLTPHLMFSRSPLIDLLVAAGIHHYVEFKAVDHAYFANSTPAATTTASDSAASASTVPSAPALSPLPLSKSAIFQTTALSMLEKRVLMKFMHLILGDDYHQSTAEVQKQTKQLETSQQSFIDFLRAQKLSTTLIQMVLYAVALVDECLADAATVPATVGIARLRAYLSSLGRYGAGAFLYPNYGTSELPQAFARLCAVNKGIFILRFKPDALVFQRTTDESSASRQYRGIITSSGQFITSDAFIADSDYLPSPPASTTSAAYTFVSRCILFVDAPLASSVVGTPLSPSSFFSLAASSPADSPIYGLQLGSEVAAAPRGRTIVYLWTSATTEATATVNATRLQQLVRGLTQPLHQEVVPGSNAKPNLLGIATYQQRVPISAEPASVVAAPAVAAADSTPSTAAPIAEASSSSSSSDAQLASSSIAAAPVDVVAPPLPPLPRLFLSTPLPSSSLAFGLDACLTRAEVMFGLLCPQARMSEVMLSNRLDDSSDQDLALLQQIEPAEQAQAQSQDEDETASSAPEQTDTSTTADAPVDSSAQAPAADAETHASTP